MEGASVCAGYRQEQETLGSSTISAGRLRTGDAGWLHGGELFVIGRMGDSIKVRGRTIYLQELEQSLARIAGMRADQFVLLPEVPGGDNDLVLLVEALNDSFEPEARKALRQQLGTHVRVRCSRVSRGTILRTSSGKPRRRVIWSQMVAGDLRLQDNEVLPESAGQHKDD